MKIKSLIALTISAILLSSCLSPAVPDKVDETTIITNKDNPDLFGQVIDLFLAEDNTAAVHHFTPEKKQNIKVSKNGEVWDTESFDQISKIKLTKTGDIYYIAQNGDKTPKLYKNKEMILESNIKDLYVNQSDELYIKESKDGKEILKNLKGEVQREARFIREVNFDNNGQIVYNYSDNDEVWHIAYNEHEDTESSYISKIAFSEENKIAYISRDIEGNFEVHIGEETIKLEESFTEIANIAFYSEDEIVFAAYSQAVKKWYININEEKIAEKDEVYNLIGGGKNIYITGRNATSKVKDFIFSLKEKKDVAEVTEIRYTALTSTNRLIYARKRAGTWLMQLDGTFVPGGYSTKGYLRISNYIDNGREISFIGEQGSGDIVLATINIAR